MYARTPKVKSFLGRLFWHGVCTVVVSTRQWGKSGRFLTILRMRKLVFPAVKRVSSLKSEKNLLEIFYYSTTLSREKIIKKEK